MNGSLKKIVGALAVVAAAFAVTTGAANAGVTFSDGTYASVHFNCNSALRTFDVIPDFGDNTTDAYFTYTKYFYNLRYYSPWSSWSTMGNQAYSAPISSSVSVGWMAVRVHYAKLIGNTWETGDEWGAVWMNGAKGYWCYMA